jgi:hypothetical protein
MKEINLNQLPTVVECLDDDILSSIKLVKSNRGRPTKLSVDQIYECIQLKSQHSIQYWKCLFRLYQKIYPSVQMPVYHNCLSSVYKFFSWIVKVINLILLTNNPNNEINL